MNFKTFQKIIESKNGVKKKSVPTAFQLVNQIKLEQRSIFK
jgi:hypothetical protein